MRPVEEIVNEINALIRSGDLSDTPQLRALHCDYLTVLEGLKRSLAQCRELIDNGSLAEARRLNCSFEPSLTRQAELLDFPKRQEFFDICQDYELEMPVLPDEKLLNTLSAPLSSGEKHLHILLQDYRKIARSGSLQERIVLLRKIVAKQSASARWRNDLLSAEKGRLLEIERTLEQLPQTMESQNQLELLLREIMSPEWSVPVKPELLEQLRERLRPLQQTALKQETERYLQVLQDLCIEQDIVQMRKTFDEWRLFSANPLLKLTPEETRAAADAEKFLLSREAEQQQAEELKALICRIEEKLSANCSYAEVAGEHNQLQLLQAEYAVPSNLLGQLDTLAAEAQQHERLKGIRRTIYGVCLILAVAASLWGFNFYRQRQKNIAQLSGEMEKSIADGKYQETQELFRSAEKTMPYAGRDLKILTLYRSAIQLQAQKQETLTRQKEEFAGVLRQLKRLSQAADVWDNAAAVDRLLAEGKKLLPSQSPKAAEEFRDMEISIARKRTARKQAQEKDFLTFCCNTAKQLEQRRSAISKADLKELPLFCEKVRLEFNEKARTTPGLSTELKNREWQKLEKHLRALGDAGKQEEILRQVQQPADFLSYAAGLEKCRYQAPALAQEYQQALAQLEYWRSIFDSYQHGFVPSSFRQLTPAELENCRGILKQDLARLMPAAARSAEFARFFADLQNLNTVKEFRLVTRTGAEYYFYTSKEIIWERLINPKRINLSFYSMEKDGFFTFRYDFSGKAEPIRSLNVPRKLPYKLPERFALPDGRKSFTRESAVQPWAGRLLTEKFSALAADGPGVCANLQAAILWLLDEKNIPNAYLKELLLVRLMDEFCRVWPLCREAADAAGKLRNFHSSRNRNWRSPQECAEYANEKKQLLTLWNSLDLKRCLAAAELRADFVCAFHARRPVPAGVVRKLPDGKYQISKFQKDRPAELLVFSGGNAVILSGGLWNDAPAKQDLKHLFNGQLLWQFEDNISSREFVNQWSRKAEKLNIRLNIRPLICPEGVSI